MTNKNSDQLPLEYPTRKILTIYARRLSIFIVIVGINFILLGILLLISECSSWLISLPIIPRWVASLLIPLLLAFFLLMRRIRLFYVPSARLELGIPKLISKPRYLWRLIWLLAEFSTWMWVVYRILRLFFAR